jgi:hypothetical protein
MTGRVFFMAFVYLYQPAKQIPKRPPTPQELLQVFEDNGSCGRNAATQVFLLIWAWVKLWLSGCTQKIHQYALNQNC